MQSGEVRSSQVYKNGGRSSLVIPRLGYNSCVKYLHKKWAIKISVYELEFNCKLEVIWNKNQKLPHL
jgi:hypothetical protein